MKRKYIVNFIIKDSVTIEAESVPQAKILFSQILQKKKVESGKLHIEYIEEIQNYD